MLKPILLPSYLQLNSVRETEHRHGSPRGLEFLSVIHTRNLRGMALKSENEESKRGNAVHEHRYALRTQTTTAISRTCLLLIVIFRLWSFISQTLVCVGKVLRVRQLEVSQFLIFRRGA